LNPLVLDIWSRFFLDDTHGVFLLYGDYSYGLVALSLLVAIAASVVSFQLAGLARIGQGRLNRQIALLTGALVLGVGIWAMHFIGMLAFEICTSVRYDLTGTFLSMIPGLLSSWIALNVLVRREITWKLLVISGVLVGAGIGSMHYAGMAAMRMGPQLRFDPDWFAASIVVAVLLAILALWIRFGLRRSKRLSGVTRMLLGGTVMGLAISGMHYTGMAAARFVGLDDPYYVQGSNVDYYMAFNIALLTVVVAAAAMSANGLMRYRELFLRMRQQQSRTRAIVETAVDGIITIDAQGIIQDVNRAAETMFGWPARDMLGNNISMLMPEPDRSRHDGYLARYLQEGDARIIGIGREVTGLRRDGSLMPMRLAIGRVETRGEPLFVGFVTDISQRHAMEQALRQAKERAEMAAEAKSSFLANISHEIRTPMNAILGFTDLVLASKLAEDQRKHLSTVRQSARSLLGLINDVLDTAKLEKGAVELEASDFSLRELCRQTLASLRLSADAKGLFLGSEYDERLGEFFVGDPLRIQQVLINLVGNAIKFTTRGSVLVRVDPGEQGGGVTISIVDTGIGIPADRIQRIFDPFAQADASTTRRFGGTGLGTTIARQLTELMGGKITVESQLGKGSTFRVFLPLNPGKPVVREVAEKRIELPPLRILIADDVPQNLELLDINLARTGHKVFKAADGRQALAVIAAEALDLVLMDVQMPEMDGLQATRQLRDDERQSGRTHLPVIALTASVLEEDYHAARAAGMDGFAAKPVDLPALYREIARVLGLHLEPMEIGERLKPIADGIDWSRGLDLWGDEAAYRSALLRFHESCPASQAALVQAVAIGDFASAAAVAHRLQGAAGNLALPTVQATCSRLEAALKAGRIEQVGSLIDTLQSAVIRAYPGQAEAGVEAVEDSAGEVSVDAGRLQPLLADLADALARGELPDELSSELLALLPVGWSGDLRRALDDFDFAGAAIQIERLTERLNEKKAV